MINNYFKNPIRFLNNYKVQIFNLNKINKLYYLDLLFTNKNYYHTQYFEISQNPKIQIDINNNLKCIQLLEMEIINILKENGPITSKRVISLLKEKNIILRFLKTKIERDPNSQSLLKSKSIFISITVKQFKLILKNVAKTLQLDLVTPENLKQLRESIWKYINSQSIENNSNDQLSKSIPTSYLHLYNKEIVKHISIDFKLSHSKLKKLIKLILLDIERSTFQLPLQAKEMIHLEMEKLLLERFLSIKTEQRKISYEPNKFMIQSISLVSKIVSKYFNISKHLLYNCSRDAFLQIERKLTKNIRKMAIIKAKNKINELLQDKSFNQYQEISFSDLKNQLCDELQILFPILSRNSIYHIIRNQLFSYQHSLSLEDKKAIEEETKNVWLKHYDSRANETFLIEQIFQSNIIQSLNHCHQLIKRQIKIEIKKLWKSLDKNEINSFKQLVNDFLKQNLELNQNYSNIYETINDNPLTLSEKFNNEKYSKSYICNILSESTNLPRFVAYSIIESESNKFFRANYQEDISKSRTMIIQYIKTLKNSSHLQDIETKGFKLNTKQICDRIQPHFEKLPRQILYSIVQQELKKNEKIKRI